MSRLRSRPVFGDGQSDTRALQPSVCPTCDGDLIITCAKGCEDAELGATGFHDPIAHVRAPKIADEPRKRREPKSAPPPHLRSLHD